MDWGLTRGRKIGMSVMALVAVGVLGTDMYLLTQRNVTHRVSLNSEVARFRAATSTTSSTAAPVTVGAPSGGPRPTDAAPKSKIVVAGPAGPAGQSAATAAQAAAPSTTAPPARTTPGSTSAPLAAATTATAAAAATNATSSIPAEGVYAYKTTGGEQVNILNSSHSYPSTTYATVRHQTGCQYAIENDVIQEHVDKRVLCGQPGKFFEVSQGRTITFFGETQGYTYTCAPQLMFASVGEPAGIKRVGVCADTSGNSARLTVTDLGSEQVTVGGVSVAAIHVAVDGVLMGAAVGSSHDDLVLLASNGLTLSWHRSVDTVANAAFGAKAHYTEKATFDLISLAPQT